MAKLKLRFREQILRALQQAKEPISLRGIARMITSKEEARNPQTERFLEKELRYLIKLKEVEKGQGNLYRLRPPKSKRAEKGRQFPYDDSQDTREPKLKSHGNQPRHKKSGMNTLVGRVIKNNRGFAFVSPENPPPHMKEDVFLNPEEAEDLLTGDIVEISVDQNRSEKGYSGRLLRVIERGLQKVVARYKKGSPYAPAMAEVDHKDLQLQILLEPDPTFKDVLDGSAILVDVISLPKGGQPARGKIKNVLADSLNSTTDDPLILVKHKLAETFPDEVMREVELIPTEVDKADYKGRIDQRELPYVTIDGADARDFDDAVCAERLPNGGTRLWVAIADVAHYVRPGTALDREAYMRGTSVYFPHRVLPMLPERLSNGLCSLNPHVDRLALVCEIDYDSNGSKMRHKVYEAVFQSHHRCVYESLQQYFDHPKGTEHDYDPKVRESLGNLFDLYKKVQKNRIKRGSVDLDLPEAKVKIDRVTGEVEKIIKVQRLDAHRLIEEFMIAANEAVSEIMIQHKQEFLFRVHETPEEDATRKFLTVANSLHLRINERWMDDITPFTYQKIVKAIETSPSSRVLNFLLLRSMKQAFYSDENLMHFGLASTAYTHFTSPIRRYPDLIVHRLLKAWVNKRKKDAQTAMGSVADNLAEAARHCSMRERVAVDAERELVRIKQVRFAEKHLGEEHQGIVVGLGPKGAYVELTDIFIEGFIPIERFGADFYFHEKLFHLYGKRSGKTIQIGERLDVQIARTNPHLLQIELEPVQGSKKKPKVEKATKPKEAPRDFWTLEDFE